MVEAALAADSGDRLVVLDLSRLACDVGQHERAVECVSPLVDDPWTTLPWDVFWLTCASMLADTVADLRWHEAGAARRMQRCGRTGTSVTGWDQKRSGQSVDRSDASPCPARSRGRI